jgi:hypothetical protein
MSEHTIFTIEARENVFFEVLKNQFNLSSEQMYVAIRDSFSYFKDSFEANKGIQYKELRNALTPNINKHEIALVFDSSKIDSGWYGYHCFNKLIPLFDKKTAHSILAGDFLINHNHYFWKDYFFEVLISTKDDNFFDISNGYIIYINNLSNSLVKKITSNLNEFDGYLGYLNMTFQTPIKSYLSIILCKTGILHKNTVILPGDEDSWTQNENIHGLPFDKHGFKIMNIPDPYFGIFLSYKIEREVFDGYENDTEFSLNAVSSIIKDLDSCKIIIEPEKLQYLLEQKGGKLKKAQIENYTTTDFEALIKEKIKDNYIYEMTELKEHNVVKFNIVLELALRSQIDKIKCSVTLSYMPEQEIIKLITFF